MKKKQMFKKAILSLALVITVILMVNAQSREITGRVIDEEGLPLPGVSVVVKGTTVGTVSGPDGNYRLTVTGQTAVLVFSFIGMKPEEVVVRNQSVINVTLKAEAYSLDEVVAVGYGTMRKANLTGSVDMVTAERLEGRPITDVGQGLQGLIPNLNVTIFSGDPTRSVDLNVRGFESINGGEPLVLVDGVPMDLNRINPQDIESITVLKDAAAGAVYGARAAFGVIMVKTKKGTGDISVRLSTELSRDVPIFHVNPVENGYEYASIRNQILVAGGSTQYYNDDYMARLKTYWDDPANQPGYAVVNGVFENYEYTRMAKEVMNTFSPKQKYDLSVAGSTEKSSFYTSFGFLNTDGFMNLEGNDNFKRYNILMKGDFKINDWFSIDQQITINSQASDKPAQAPINSLIRVEPIRAFVVPYLEDYPELEGEYWSNPNEFMLQNQVENGGRAKWTNTDTWLKSGVKLDPVKGLQIVSDFSYRIFNRQSERGAPQYRSVNYDLTKENHFDYFGDNTVSVSSNHDQYYVFNTYAEYTMKDLENHFIKGMVGFNQEWGRFTRVSGSALYPVSGTVIDIGATTGTQSITGGKEHVALRGAFYRFNYIFKDKYLFEANGRYDGTSRFGMNSRFGFFPSFSAAWRISNEGFMAGTKHILDDLKFRVSYGTLGNQVVQNPNNSQNYYPYIATMAVTETNFPLATGKLPVIRMPGLISPDLTWETVVSKNLGVDLSVFKQRLNASFDIYSRATTDMLMRMDYPDILGTNAPFENAADLINKGWEFSIKWRDRISNDLSYDLAFSLADWTAEITKYENLSGAIGEHYVGEKLGEIWGYETVGFIQDEEQLAKIPDQSALGIGWKVGDLEFKDLNNDGKINQGSNTLSDPGDRRIIGNQSPRYTFGLNSGINYKDFSIAAFFQGIGKRDYYPSRNSWTWFFPFASLNMDRQWIDDAWRPDNRDAYWPAIQYTTKNYPPQTRYLQNAAYVRVKSLTVSYNLPVSLLGKVGLKSGRLYIAGQNLWELSKIRKPLDPEYVFSNSIDYPLMRTYSVGLIINL
jgi:TonB-linked SusC/RagA family outer membrane protein